MEKTLFTDSHMQWNDFTSKLLHSLYAHNENGTIEGSCSDDFHHTRKLLNLIPGIDVNGSIANFREMYGCICDCTLANIIK